jgi:hypothetical protein
MAALLIIALALCWLMLGMVSGRDTDDQIKHKRT